MPNFSYSQNLLMQRFNFLLASIRNTQNKYSSLSVVPF